MYKVLRFNVPNEVILRYSIARLYQSILGVEVTATECGAIGTVTGTVTTTGTNGTANTDLEDGATAVEIATGREHRYKN